jgi:hypothetical protein
MQVLTATDTHGNRRMVVVTEEAAKYGELGAKEGPAGWQVALVDDDGWKLAVEVWNDQPD